MALPSLDFKHANLHCPLNCHKQSKLKGACLKKILIIPVKEVDLKSINYKTIDANSPAFFFFAKDFSMSPLEVTRHCGSVHLGVVVLRVGYFEHALLQLNNCHHILPEKINPVLYLFAEPHIT